jgi:hypothetical protein
MQYFTHTLIHALDQVRWVSARLPYPLLQNAGG